MGKERVECVTGHTTNTSRNVESEQQPGLQLTGTSGERRGGR